MGDANKLLLPVDGAPMVRRALERILATDPVEVVVVLGHDADRVREAVGDRARFVLNPDYEEGQMTSVRAGLAALTMPSQGVMIALSDQPGLEVEDLVAIRDAFVDRSRGAIVVPTYQGRRGNPIVLDRAQVDVMLARGTRFGCRQLIADHPDLVETFAMTTDRILRDVDRPEDYAAL